MADSLGRTHASFFSGVGGLDLGLERAGWRTVSFSEIEPYAKAVLAERWPDVPDLGDIVRLARSEDLDQDGRVDGGRNPSDRLLPERDDEHVDRSPAWHSATLWSGGFPCQDLSVAGKRRGMGSHDERLDSRSGLAYAFLDLVERHRPPAILLENVPGLLSSNAGKDFGALLSRLGELGYWWAYRILDGQFSGVPQRRRRVFIVAIHASTDLGPDSPAEVLSVGTRCERHSAPSWAARTGVALGTGEGVELAGSLTRRYGKGINTTLDDGAAIVAPPVRAGRHGDSGIGRDNDEDRLVVGTLNDLGHHGWTANAQSVDAGHVIVGQTPDPGGVRAADGLAGRVDDRPELAPTLRVGPAHIEDGGPGDTVPIVVDKAATLNSNKGGGWRYDADQAENLVFVKKARAQTNEDDESWAEGEVAPTLNAFDGGDARATALTFSVAPEGGQGADLRATQVDTAPSLGAAGGEKSSDRGVRVVADVDESPENDPLLPLGLDSHRYRCCGNGVIAPVSEFIGHRLAAVLTTERPAG